MSTGYRTGTSLTLQFFLHLPRPPAPAPLVSIPPPLSTGTFLVTYLLHSAKTLVLLWHRKLETTGTMLHGFIVPTATNK